MFRTRRGVRYPVLGLVAIVALAVTPSFGQAQALIDHLEPPVLQRGKTTRVTFVGSQLAQSIALWSTLPTNQFKATPINSDSTRAVFDVQVAADGPVGLCGVRVATRDGLSNVHLLLIDDLPPVAHRAAAEPMKIALPAAVWGTIRTANVDRFTIDVTAGQRVSFEVVGNRFGKDVDPLVTLRDDRGQWLAEHDNDPGLFFDCRFEYVFNKAGTYTVEVRDARFHAPAHGLYVLRIGRFPAARVALPAAVRPGRRNELFLPEVGGPPIGFDVPADQPEGPFIASLRRAGDDGSTWVPLTATSADITLAQKPSNTLEKATQAPMPGIMCGVLDKPGDRVFFRIDLQRGQRIQVRGEARAIQSPADLELVVVDAKGKEMRRASDPGGDEVRLDFTASAAGTYGLMVRDLARDGGSAFAFRLDVRNAQPGFTVSADVEGLTIPQGSYQTLPLTLTRSERFGPIKLRLIGAPPGLTLNSEDIADTANTFIAKLSAGAEVPCGLYTLQIKAEPAQAGSDVAAVLVRTQPLIDQRRVNVDLIPYALREDQRRLPPALTDRLAVLVTPPAPFTMDLPEPLVTLARYQHADIPILTTRSAGFDGPITFTARGGQLADKKEGRTRVYAEFAPATPDQLQATGRIHSRILSNIGRTRIEVEGTASHQGRRITLTRSFDLELRPAFRVSAEQNKLTLFPGETARFRVLADRVKTFDGPITVQFVPLTGFELPASVQIPRGQESVEVAIKVAADLTPRRQSIRMHSTAAVQAFEEDQQGILLEIDVRKPEAPKK